MITNSLFDSYRSHFRFVKIDPDAKHKHGDQETTGGKKTIRLLYWNNRGPLSVLGNLARVNRDFRSKVLQLMLEGFEAPGYICGPVFVLRPTLPDFWKKSNKELLIFAHTTQGPQIHGLVHGSIEAIVVVLGTLNEVLVFPEHIFGPDGSFNSKVFDSVADHANVSYKTKANAYFSALVRGNIAVKGRMVIKYLYKSDVKVGSHCGKPHKLMLILQQSVLVDISLASLSLLDSWQL